MHFGELTLGEVALYLNPRTELLVIVDDIKVYLVDGFLTSVHDARWVSSARTHYMDHHWGEHGAYIPEDEVWISDRVPTKELPATIQRVLCERALCAGGTAVKEPETRPPQDCEI